MLISRSLVAFRPTMSVNVFKLEFLEVFCFLVVPHQMICNGHRSAMVAF